MTSDATFDLTLLGLTASITYLIHHYGFQAKRIQQLLEQREIHDAQALGVYFQRLIGGLWLGLVPALILFIFGNAQHSFGLGLPGVGATSLLIAGVLLLAVPAIAFNSKNPEIRQKYPEVRRSRWSGRQYLMNAATWAVYLVGYEILFRGVLLFTLAAHLGTWPAISLMTAIYTLSHIDKTADETFGCIPVGVLFGFTALYADSVLGPCIAHWIIAVSNEYFCAPRGNTSVKSA
jgi:membrane protease YdiL (CAAX protease family)